jgi:hypothetical protein
MIKVGSNNGDFRYLSAMTFAVALTAVAIEYVYTRSLEIMPIYFA